MSQEVLAGVELGGTKCICVLGDADGQLIEQQQVPTTDPGATLATVESIFDGWKIGDRASAIGVASFGPLDLDHNSHRYGSIAETPKRGWAHTDIVHRLKRRYGLPIGFDTDVNGAALAEGVWGAAQDLSSWAYVTAGTGVGVGLIIGRSPVRGLSHAEAGHMRIARMAGDSWPGNCPFHQDCVEGLASGPAIAGRAGRDPSEVRDNDPVWPPVAHALAAMAHNLVLTAVPERILFGGGVMTRQPHLLPLVRGALLDSLAGYGAAHSIAARIDDYVSAALLGADAGPLGAIALARAVVSGGDRQLFAT